MALDTRNRRLAAIGYKQPFIAAYPNPDGSLAAAADRQQVAGEYPGVAPAAPSPGSPMMIRHHHHGL